MASTALKQIKTALGLNDHHTYTDIFIRVKAVLHDRDQLTKLSADLRTQRDALYERLTQVVDVTGEPTLEELVNVVLKRLDSAQRLEGLVITDMDGNTLYWELSEGVVEINSDTQPTHDKRYIVHGDIQPCVVLYSDETTTLVRLDENDMMCETSTIEWSDELTYRCQEMLKSESVRKDAVFVKHATPVLAKLVRDERVLLNDDDGGTYLRKPAMDARPLCIKPDTEYSATKTCNACCYVTGDTTLDLCPQCHTPFGGETDA